MVRAVIVPGCGCKRQSVRSSCWYGWLEKRLLKDGRFSEVVLKDMPDPLAAKRRIWLPFMLANLGCDASTVVIGHSSGAVAAMRLLEEHELAGALLVSACHTDLGCESERAAGYYPPSGGPWQWEAIQRNAGGNVCVLHSDDDPFIPLREAEHVAQSLGAPLRVEKGRSHFFEPGEDLVQAAEVSQYTRYMYNDGPPLQRGPRTHSYAATLALGLEARMAVLWSCLGR